MSRSWVTEANGLLSSRVYCGKYHLEDQITHQLRFLGSDGLFGSPVDDGLSETGRVCLCAM